MPTLPRLMGILNVTPDSFSDGGRFDAVENALRHAEQMLADGAEIIDVGGESTRPGAEPVSLETELVRVVPVVRALVARFPHATISIDTQKAEVARQALEEGAAMINDVSALADPWMPALLRDRDVPVVLMHRQGDSRTMQNNPIYDDVVGDVTEDLRRRAIFALEQGIRRERIFVDPGLGFGKTTEHNVALLRNLDKVGVLGFPLVVGASRKSFIGRLLGRENEPLPVTEREEGTLAAHLWAAHRGAAILRVHDVRATARALTVWRALAATN